MSARPAVYLSTFVAGLGGLLFGFDTAVISGTTESLQSVYALDEFWLGFTVAIALIGTVMGAVAVGRPADAIGRKRILLAIAAMFFVSAIGSAVAPSWMQFLFYRWLGGIAVGGASVVAPMYIAEIAPAALRGRLVAFYQLNIVLGILLAYLSNFAVASVVDGDLAWRWMFAVEAVPAALMFALLPLIPMSPRWLVKRSRGDEARLVLRRLGVADEGRALAEIGATLERTVDRTAERLFQRRYGRPLMLAFAMATFNQLSGINALIYYAPRIFAQAGAATDDALLQGVAVGFTNFVFTLAALALIDRFGRRPLMLVGSVGMAACLALVAVAFYAGGMGGTVLVGLLGFIACFAFSQGAVIWVYLSEIFPNRVRARGQSFGTFTHWAMAAAVSWTFPIVAEVSGGHAFALFSAMMVLQLVFVIRVMPETNGLSLETLGARITEGRV